MGLDAIAAPVYSADGEVVAAIDVSGPAHRLQAGGGLDFVGLTKDAAADVSRRLGFRARASR
jgi:DNA-binding IclR family transcriptional regulator